MKDERTNLYLKHWGRPDVPVGHVIHGKVPLGQHHAYAQLGWVEQRRTTWPVVGLALTVLDDGLEKSLGSMTMGLPLTPKTENLVCQFLEHLGWDGRCWPYKDHGWPETTEEESGLLLLLKKAGLGATMTFPPQSQGTPAVLIPVLHRTKPFSVIPFAEETPVPRYLEELRILANDPTPFKSDWAK